MPDPAAVARNDQLQAASAEAASWLAQRGAGEGTSLPLDQAPPWLKEAHQSFAEAVEARAATYCLHLVGRGPQVVVIQAEYPEEALCRACAQARAPHRFCLTCCRGAGTSSPAGGVEDTFESSAVVYSRVRCPTCVERAALDDSHPDVG
ncbi:hypothetical protein [Streptomyces sp. NBC_00690]|uniref:hypothetical protein n=1 Tax=Streptomyces sp. NBC_00690 TaxID=2975808 RepID=UPI002E27C752|nr:hypothetical protein [Streptomyces sp. NBC_00690]